MKTAVVSGVANKYSIAWSCAKKLAAEGYRVVLTYQNERLYDNVSKLANELPLALIAEVDVSNPASLKDFGEKLPAVTGHQVDTFVHSLAFAPREALEGRYLDTSLEAFQQSLQISAFSLVQMTKAILPCFHVGASIVTMSYLGAERAIPNYNVMGVAKAALESSVRYLAADLGETGIRVNAISAGPVKTLAAKGIKGFSGMLTHHALKAPLRRNVTVEEVASAAFFLCSPLSSGVTGQVLHVDAGYNIVGA